ncbi:MAG: hypothetical protein K0R54_4298 [Clostridiaceae bacterium]|jgi:hypothetical protein|nr:hypothetical protein [Clostridiaceae bacterium]
MKKKYLLIIVFSIIVFSIIFSYNFFYNSTSEKSLLSYNKKYTANNTTVLKKITINKSSVIFILKDNNDALYLLITKKNLLNNWKVTQLMGYTAMNEVSDTNRHWQKISYNNNLKDTGLYYGFLHNGNIRKITINNKKCKIVNLDNNLYMWYCFSDFYGTDLKIIR